jgi:hypothetical protein
MVGAFFSFNLKDKRWNMNIIGIDLSGPANHKDTVIAILKEDNQKLKIHHLEAEISDE